MCLHYNSYCMSLLQLNNQQPFKNTFKQTPELVFIEPVNKSGDTPFSLACANGHLDTVKYLVNKHHCDPRSKFIYFPLNILFV